MSCLRGVLVLVVLCQVLSGVFCDGPENDVERGMHLLYKTYQSCEASGDMVPCLKIKALKLADRALKINSIPLFEGITVIRNEGDDGRSFSAPDFEENTLPQDPEERDDTLDGFLVDRVTRFLKSHSLQFSLPKLTGEPEGEEGGEGRGKNKQLKKYMGPLIMAAMIKGGLFAYAMKAVGLLAAKALLISKIALVLASVVGLKKLFSSGGGAESKTIEIVQKPQISHSHAYSGHDFGGIGGQGWETSGQGGSSGGGGGGGGGYGRRSFDTSMPFPEAQELAYRGRARQ